MHNVNPNSYASSFLKLSKRLTVIALLMFFVAACSQKTADDHIAQAQAFIESGDNDAAVVALKNAIQKDPMSGKARLELGKLYIEVDDYQSAEKELSRAIELGEPEKDIVPLLAKALQRTGANVALVDLEYDQTVLTGAERIEVGFRKLQSLVQLEKNAEANALVRDLLLIDTNTVYIGLVKAYEDILDEKYEDALEKSKEMYERAPLNSDVLNLTARLYVLNGEGDLAADMYENYIKVTPEDTEAKFALANMLVEQKKPERAEKYIDELLEVSETNPLLNQLKGVVRAADNDYKNAKLYSENAIRAGRTDPAVRLIAGFASYQLEDYQAAVGHLSLVASLLPDNHPGLRILAASQLQANMGDDAGNVLDRVNDITAADASLFSRAGYELIKAGNTDAAKEIIEQAEKISETSDDLTRLGVLKLSMNDIEGLIDLESAVEKSPDSVTAKTTLASAYLGTDQLDKAYALAKQWQKDEPSSIEGLLLEVEVLQRQARYAEAAVVLDKAAKLDPSNTPVKLSSIRLDLRQEKFGDATKKTEALLNIEPTNLPALATYFALKNEAGAPEVAVNKIQSALTNNPDNTGVALLLGRIKTASGKPEEALVALQNIEATRQAPAAYWPIQGVSLVRSGRVDEALVHYENWGRLYPNQQAAVTGQLMILDSKRDYEKGSRLANDFLQRKQDIQVQIMQSYFTVMVGDFRRATELLDAIDDQYQALPFLRGVRARIAIVEGRSADAVPDAKAAYDANSNSDNLFLYVRALDENNQSDVSYDVITQHLKNEPRDGRARLVLAERQMSIDPNAAIASYKAMLEEFPNNFVVLNNLAYLTMESGNLVEAAEFGEKAYAVKPENPAVADTYAQVLIKQNKLQEAIDVYNRAMTGNINSDEINLNYIEALIMNKSSTIAKRRIDGLKLTTAEGRARLADIQEKYFN